MSMGLAAAVTHLEGDNCHLVNWIQGFDVVRRSQDSNGEPGTILDDEYVREASGYTHPLQVNSFNSPG
jgi:hypothetical protein